MSRLVNVTNLSPCAPVAVCGGAVPAADQSASSPERMPPPLPPAEASGASVDKENPLTLATVVPPLTLREYGACAMRTAVYPGIGNNVPYAALGLVGEAGEVQKRTKRALPFNQTAPPTNGPCFTSRALLSCRRSGRRQGQEGHARRRRQLRRRSRESGAREGARRRAVVRGGARAGARHGS